VKRSNRIYKSLFLLFLLTGCYSYRPFVIKSKIFVKDIVPSEKTGKKYFIKKNKKYFVFIRSSSAIARINNRGVDLALKGKFHDAEALFRESLREDSDQPAVYNNLGIIYEIFRLRKKAFDMYSRACIKEPDNSYFRDNFLSFINPQKNHTR
jgi:tetratricopeptide (TPR) repeat protein